MSNQLKAPNPATAGGNQDQVREVVRTVIEDVRARGDEAVREYSQKFDSWAPESFFLGREQAEEIVASLPTQVVDDIREVQASVREFAQLQRDSMHDFEVRRSPASTWGSGTCRSRRPVRTFRAAGTRSPPRRT